MSVKLEDVFNFKITDSGDGKLASAKLITLADEYVYAFEKGGPLFEMDRLALLLLLGILAAKGDMKTEFVAPPVFIINGFGGSGKDTFIELVDEILSSACSCRGFIANISPIYPAIEKAIEALSPDMEVMLKHTSIMEDYSPGEIFSKTPQWRTLAHEIKNAWHKVNDGPNVWILSKVISAVTVNEKPGAIFIHVREAENIERLETALIKMGFAVASILVDGRVSESSQPEDRSVLDYKYDIIIDNSATIDALWLSAYGLAFTILGSLCYDNKWCNPRSMCDYLRHIEQINNAN